MIRSLFGALAATIAIAAHAKDEGILIDFTKKESFGGLGPSAQLSFAANGVQITMLPAFDGGVGDIYLLNFGRDGVGVIQTNNGRESKTRIDAGKGAEAITITFGREVVLEKLTLNKIKNGSGTVRIGFEDEPIPFKGGSAKISQPVMANEVITIEPTNESSFSLAALWFRLPSDAEQAKR